MPDRINVGPDIHRADRCRGGRMNVRKGLSSGADIPTQKKRVVDLVENAAAHSQQSHNPEYSHSVSAVKASSARPLTRLSTPVAYPAATRHDANGHHQPAGDVAVRNLSWSSRMRRALIANSVFHDGRVAGPVCCGVVPRFLRHPHR
jgi:hypothetical protein